VFGELAQLSRVPSRNFKFGIIASTVKMDFLGIKSNFNLVACGIFPGKPQTSIFEQIDARDHAGLEFEII
jgi:hypothetical protein